MSGEKRGTEKRNPYRDNISLSVTILNEGRDIDQMFDEAKVEAAAILGRPIDRLYIKAHTPLEVGSQTRFRANLEEPSFVESWKMQITVAVIPDWWEGEDNDGEPEDRAT